MIVFLNDVPLYVMFVVRLKLSAHRSYVLFLTTRTRKSEPDSLQDMLLLNVNSNLQNLLNHVENDWSSARGGARSFKGEHNFHIFQAYFFGRSNLKLIEKIEKL